MNTTANANLFSRLFDTLGDPKLGKQWHRAVATVACHMVASRSRDAAKRRRRKEDADAAQ